MLSKKIVLKEKEIKNLIKNSQSKRVITDYLSTELAYTSNAIEGNTLTRKETALIISKDITSGSKPLKDYIEAKNHAMAFNLVLELSKKKSDIEQDDILRIHRQILKGIDDDFVGRYRNVSVRIAGSQTVFPNSAKVYALMSDLVENIRADNSAAICKAAKAHLNFVSIHHFIDGNGRTARLLLNLILLKNKLLPIIIRPQDRKHYIDVIEEAQITKNAQNYFKFIFSVHLRSMKFYLRMFK